jgi:hypothetical protein
MALVLQMVATGAATTIHVVAAPLIFGGSAAVLLAVPKDYGLILAGALTLILRFARPAMLPLGGQRHA